jgi:flagellar M-ring protein FliF
MDKFRQYIDKSLMLWSTLERWQKLSILLAICGVLVLLVIIIILGSSPSYVRLFSNLDVEDQTKISDYLRQNNRSYRIDTELQSIFVPGNQADEIRLDLAQAGLPKSGTIIDYSDFMKDSFGKSQNHINTLLLRALEGELSKNLRQLDFIENAKVNIVVPERELFKKDINPSSAGVMLTLRPGYRMTPQQVKAVIHLVAACVPRLAPDNVIVVDSSSNILSDMLNDDPFIIGPDGKTTAQRLFERMMEKELMAKAKSVLEPTYGLDRIVVEVTVEANFDKKTETIKEIVPGENGKGAIVSQQTMEETYKGTGTPPGGAPGTTSNIPGYNIATDRVDSEYNKSDVTNNFQNSTREIDTVFQQGTITRVTASVIVDGEDDERVLNSIEKAVAHAIGLKEARGDRISVISLPFIALPDSTLDTQRGPLIIRVAIGFIMLLIISILAILWWKRRKAAQSMNKMLQESRHIPTIQEMLTSPEMIAAQGELSVLEEQIKAYARSNPKEVSSLVNEWLSED